MENRVAIPIRQRPFQRVGDWLPQKASILQGWLKELVKEVKDAEKKRSSFVLGGPVEDFKQLIESTAELRMLASAMFDEVPDKAPYKEDPVGNRQLRSYQEMLGCFQIVMESRAPEWRKVEYDVGLIGFPFNAILDWPMATPSGYAFFLRADVNAALKKILDQWSKDVLMTDASQYVLNQGEKGWLGEEALSYIEADTNVDGHDRPFSVLFECNTDLPHWGFKSWDDFFIRKFRDFDTIRPTAYLDKPEWIVNSCESKSFSLQSNVKEYDNFWLKGQSYSVAEMLNHHDWASQFIGGSVYQAFLSATSYHRWNSPVSGKVVYSAVIPGTYFSEPTITGFTSPDGPDPAAPDHAQGYISHVATRAVFFIQADEPVGLIALLYIGMADVSSCEILTKFQQGTWPAQVKKGEELGMFHHGGSTYCLLTRPSVKLAWVPEATPANAKKNLPIRSELAYVYKTLPIPNDPTNPVNVGKPVNPPY
ncbi:L-tryptophan decarboxylase [Cladobotryum mycophilum]|uniref:L-tryptophan decarboxylase n=1 Tax=Cladobotryum mycophilum TaxID=491253 RepID=A0ABR0SW47_9HYPO